MMSSFMFIHIALSLNRGIASLVFNGCESSLWSKSYYSSKLFSTTTNSTDCMMIPSDGAGCMQIAEGTRARRDKNRDKIIPTVWYDIGSESAVFYNISFDLRCDLVGDESINHFDVMYRVQWLSDKRDTFENNKNFGGYSLRLNCGLDSNIISVKQYPISKTMDTNADSSRHQFDLNSGKRYKIQIIVGDKAESDPRKHKIYINNKLVLNFYDSSHLFGGIGISSLIADGVTNSRQKVSTFYINNFIVTGIGSDDSANVQCEEEGEIKHINWMDLSRNASLKPNVDFKMDINNAELSLHIKVELDYIGYSYCGRLEEYGYGTTYILDFESFDAHHSAVNEPGTCSNRLAESFQNETFGNWWNYSPFPYLEDEIGAINNNLAYPKPSPYWYLYMKYSQCSPVVYEAKFDINDLRNCGNHDQTKKYLQFVNDDEWMNITGTFYVNLVSPMSKDSDVGYYYVYQLLSAPFVISIKKVINIMSSSGISLFTMTFVSVYKQQNEARYSLILLTESSDYLYLTFNQLLDVPSDSLQIAEKETECLALRQNMCSQLFEVTAYPVACAQDTFSGQYGIRFNIECNPAMISNASSKVCEEWLNAEIEAIQDNTVDLFVDLEFEDTICDTRVYLIEFNAAMNFYIDDAFSNLQTDTRNGYEIGVDRLYVAIELDFSGGAYDILEADLINVWLCTIEERYQNDDSFIVSQSGDEGGCFAAIVDQPYHIVQNGRIAMGYDSLDTIIYDRDIDDDDLFTANQVRFSFMVPNDIIRDKLYVHSQITIKLISQDEDTDASRTNRRILEENVNVQDQVRHFMHYTRIEPAAEETVLQHTQTANKMPDFLKWMDLKTIVMMIVVAALLATGMTLFIMKHRRRNSVNSRMARYETH